MVGAVAVESELRIEVYKVCPVYHAAVDAVVVQAAQGGINECRAITSTAAVFADADGAELSPWARQAVGVEAFDGMHRIFKGENRAAIYAALSPKHHVI